MNKKMLLSLLVVGLIAISSISIVSAAMEIEGGAFFTDGGLDDLTFASIDVGSKYSEDNVIIQIWYSRDGSILNDGNMVPKTVTSDGFINVKSAEPYKYFPDHAKINLYDKNYNLLDSQEVTLSQSKGVQVFGNGDYDYSYIKGPSSNTKSSSDSSSSASSTSNSKSNVGSRVDVTTSDTFYFYPIDCFIADEGYCASIEVDGDTYYLGESEYDKLCEYSGSFASGMICQYQDTSTTQKIKMGIVGTIETPGDPVGDFELPVDKPFSFYYKIGKVGLDKKAKIVTTLYL